MIIKFYPKISFKGTFQQISTGSLSTEKISKFFEFRKIGGCNEFLKKRFFSEKSPIILKIGLFDISLLILFNENSANCQFNLLFRFCESS